MFSINIWNVTGSDGFQLELSVNSRGWDLMDIVGQHYASDTPGVWNAVVDGSLIDPFKTLAELGLVDGADVTAVFEAATAADVRRISRAYYELDTMSKKDLLIFSSLRDLHFHYVPIDLGQRLLIRSMEKVTLPSGLQSLTFGDKFQHRLTFGDKFYQSIEKVALPSGLQSLTFGYMFNHSMEKVALPPGLQSLTFGYEFNQSMEKVALPSGLQNLKFGYMFNQSMENVALPSGLQSLTFGYVFNQSMEKVALPSGLKNLKFGYKFSRSMEKVTLPSGLQSLTLGPMSLNQSMGKVAFPSALQVHRP